MKKYIIPVLLIISLAINAYFVCAKIIDTRQMNRLHSLFDIKPVTYPDGLKSLFQKLNNETPEIFKEQEYLFIQTWDSITTMPSILNHTIHLDSIFATTAYAKMDKLLVSEMPQGDMNEFMKAHRVKLKAFNTIGDADDFISSVFTLKKAKGKSHPMQCIINKKGELLYYNAHLSGIEAKDSTLYYVQKIIQP